MSGDSDGYKRGEKGYAKDSAAGAFLKPDFNRDKLYGPFSGDGNDGGFDPKNRGSKGDKS